MATRLWTIVLLVCAWNISKTQAQDLPRQFQDRFQEIFERFSNESNRFMPGFMGEIPPEELARLEKIQVSVQEENKFGQQVLDGYLEAVRHQNRQVLKRGPDVEYLQQLVTVIKPLMKNSRRYRQIDIQLVETDSTDAYSIPGGHLIFTTGLLSDVTSEAALVGVVAHELAHLDRGHQLIALKQSKQSNQRMDFRSGMLAIAVLARPARPEYEKQADGDAVRWMMEAGYDARELAHLLSHWATRQDRQTPWMKMMPPFIKSHPDPDRRAQAILQQVDQLSRQFPQASYVGKKNLDERIPKSIKLFPE